MGRSAAVVLCFLQRHAGMSVDAAVAHLVARRQEVQPVVATYPGVRAFAATTLRLQAARSRAAAAPAPRPLDGPRESEDSHLLSAAESAGQGSAVARDADANDATDNDDEAVALLPAVPSRPASSASTRKPSGRRSQRITAATAAAGAQADGAGVSGPLTARRSSRRLSSRRDTL